MTEQLSGRDLDKALAVALGWKERPPFRGNTNLHREWDSPDGLQLMLPKFHSSVDALRAVEPEECAIDVQRRSDKGWLVKIFRIAPWEEVARATGEGEPEARARALLAWLKRNQE